MSKLPILTQKEIEAYNKYAAEHNATQAAGQVGIGVMIFGLFILAGIAALCGFGGVALACLCLGALIAAGNYISNPRDHFPTGH